MVRIVVSFLPTSKKINYGFFPLCAKETSARAGFFFFRVRLETMYLLSFSTFELEQKHCGVLPFLLSSLLFA